jgi:hypothetical protein
MELKRLFLKKIGFPLLKKEAKSLKKREASLIKQLNKVQSELKEITEIVEKGVGI